MHDDTATRRLTRPWQVLVILTAAAVMTVVLAQCGSRGAETATENTTIPAPSSTSSSTTVPPTTEPPTTTEPPPLPPAPPPTFPPLPSDMANPDAPGVIFEHHDLDIAGRVDRVGRTSAGSTTCTPRTTPPWSRRVCSWTPPRIATYRCGPRRTCATGPSPVMPCRACRSGRRPVGHGHRRSIASVTTGSCTQRCGTRPAVGSASPTRRRRVPPVPSCRTTPARCSASSTAMARSTRRSSPTSTRRHGSCGRARRTPTPRTSARRTSTANSSTATADRLAPSTCCSPPISPGPAG